MSDLHCCWNAQRLEIVFLRFGTFSAVPVDDVLIGHRRQIHDPGIPFGEDLRPTNEKAHREDSEKSGIHNVIVTDYSGYYRRDCKNSEHQTYSSSTLQPWLTPPFLWHYRR